MVFKKKTLTILAGIAGLAYASPVVKPPEHQIIMKKQISAFPGSLSALPFDTDKDGDLDLLIGLPEGIKLMENNGKSRYSYKRMIYSSQNNNPYTKVDIDLADFDKDGIKEIVYSTSEGVRILKKKQDKYILQFFCKSKLGGIPETGIETIITDVDNDGDEDILFTKATGIELFKNNK